MKEFISNVRAGIQFEEFYDEFHSEVPVSIPSGGTLSYPGWRILELLDPAVYDQEITWWLSHVWARGCDYEEAFNGETPLYGYYKTIECPQCQQLNCEGPVAHGFQ